MSKKILILEDDSIQNTRIKLTINNSFPELSIYSAYSYFEAVSLFNQQGTFAFFILDIDLGDNPEMKDGLDFARYIRSMPEYEFTPMIFISSVSNRLEEALQTTHCYEFIKKPYNDEAVINAVNKMLMMPEPTPAILDIKGVNDSRLRIVIKEIIYIESIGHDLIIHTGDNDYLSKSEALKKVLSMLPSNFIQCHRSYIVNTHKSLQFNATDNSICINGVATRIPIGRKYREIFKS
ncbi:MAG: LytTR family DNA-binding domain-containing protein [Lachnospiraceae bacterium]|nr:LytTR family DNA-binding domain-containing protein [Lachnospiraceae bacterium]